MVLEIVSNPAVNLMLITLLPGIELRGSIPYGILTGLDPSFVFITTVGFNILLFFPIWYGLHLLYDKWLSKSSLIRKRVDHIHRKGKPLVEKYGFWGLVVFVAIPLPGSGVYSGTILAWLLGMRKRRAFPAAAIGTFIAGVIVSIISIGAGNFF